MNRLDVVTKRLVLGLAAAVVGAVLGVSTLACQVNIPEDAVFSCATDADCDGAPWKCVKTSEETGFCCKPSDELCDGVDNDCNGTVDDLAAGPECYTGPAGTQGVGECKPGAGACENGEVKGCVGQVLPSEELCNGKDDDCDGQTDEAFDFDTDEAHCGGCGKPCGQNEVCLGGACKSDAEGVCGDGVDDEGDGKTDCADEDCQGQSCGAGCTCVSLAKSETGCEDGSDNDGDGPADCADSDCDGLACGTGCTCGGGAKEESSCGDGNDNDGDGPVDCADSDCDAQACGAGCTCGGGTKKETSCGDGNDNDGDGPQDCADPDCDAQACGTGCTCETGAKKETSCNDASDNDGDGPVDCADSDCDGAACGVDCVCQGGVKKEANCGDFIDNDGDGQQDCADATDCPVGTSCKYRQGSNIRNGTCKAGGTCGQ